jgi:hypothetical protein
VLQKIHTNENFDISILTLIMTFFKELTPLPLPSFGKMNLDEVEQQQQGKVITRSNHPL